MTWYESLILGIIQGLTEFLPVSSSAHLEIGSVLLHIEANDNLLFTIVVHAATALATMLVFRKDIIRLMTDLFKFEWNDSTKFIFYILVSMIPVFVVGIFFKDQIESLFSGNLLLVGSLLLCTGLLLLFVHYRKSGEGSVSSVSAFVIGIAQAVAILPGISRSGATISTALLLGIDRAKAAQFSFLMVLLPISGASILQLKDYLDNPVAHNIEAISLTIGFVAAFISGFLACKWMLLIVKKEKLTYFALYCILVGLISVTFRF